MTNRTKADRLNSSVLGILVRVARLKQGYSLRSLSALTNISHTLISNIEKGKQPPSETTLADIFNVLDLRLFTSPKVQEEMSQHYKNIYTKIVNHHYNEAFTLVNKMEEQGDIYERSYEVVNYFIIRCLFYSITDTYLDELDKLIEQYEKVFEFFTNEQKKLFYFIKGMNYLNIDEYSRASDNFEEALDIEKNEFDTVIKEYIVTAYIKQYKFTDSISLATSAIEEFEEKTVYVRAMKCRLLIASIYIKILKLDKAKKLVDYVDSFTNQFNIDILTDESHILKSRILFFKNEYGEAIKELESHSNHSSKKLVFHKFRTYLMSKDSGLNDYYKEVMNEKKDLISKKDYLLIKVLMMWINIKIRDDIEYVESLNELLDISVGSNDQEIIGLTHNLLIKFYREKRKYKKALEIADSLLLLKRIHLSYYEVKNQ